MTSPGLLGEEVAEGASGQVTGLEDRASWNTSASVRAPIGSPTHHASTAPASGAAPSSGGAHRHDRGTTPAAQSVGASGTSVGGGAQVSVARSTAASAAVSALSMAMRNNQEDAPACDSCGAITVRSGTCYKCLNCGASMGCS